MSQRWRSEQFPGTKSITKYMQDECIKFSVISVTLYQVTALFALYCKANYFINFVREDLSWEESDPIFADNDWLEKL